MQTGGPVGKFGYGRDHEGVDYEKKHLGKGKSPLDHVIRNWHKFGNREPRDAKDMAGKGVPIPFLAGPPKDGKRIDAVEVESKLGKLSCSGSTGTLEIETDTTTVRYDFENRLHEQAPFGVVTAVWKFEMKMKKDGQIKAAGTVKLTIAGVDSTAASELPNSN